MKFRLVEENTIDYFLSFSNNSIREALDELLFIHDTNDLFEERVGTRYLQKDLAGRFISSGNVNSKGTKINSAKDVAQYVKIFRDSRFETFRIIYVKNDTIVGRDDVLSSLPDSCSFIRKHKSSNDVESLIRSIVHYKNQMNRFGADGYYICHNHPTGKMEMSEQDKFVTEIFRQNIDGFLGHIIIGTDSCLFFDGNNSDIFSYDDFKRGNVPLLDTRNKIINYASNYSSDNKSILLYVNNNNELVSTQEIDNNQFSDKNIYRYLKNQKLDNGSVSLFLYSEDIDVIKYCTQAIVNKVISNAFYYDKNSGRVYTFYEMFRETGLENNPLSESKVKYALYKDDNDSIYH